MGIKIPDNLMNRPLVPGGVNMPDPTRAFGNQVERSSNMPSAPNGWGGVPNEAAAVPGQAMAAAAKTITNSITDTAKYFEDLRTAEEDSRAKLMFLEIEKKDAEVRTRLDADPEYSKQGTAEQQQRYESERDIEIDKVHTTYGFSQPRIVKSVDDGLAQFRAQASSQYLEKVVKPRIVQTSRLNDAKSDDMVIGKVAVETTAENVAKAAANIVERYDSPQAYATYGAVEANNLRVTAVAKLTATALNGFKDKLDVSELANIPGGIVSTENFKEGPVGSIVGDQIGHLNTILMQLPITEQERQQLAMKGEKFILDYTKTAIRDHNHEVTEANKARLDNVQDMVDTFTVQLGMKARNGQLSDRAALQQFNNLLEHPDIKGDPQAVKKAYLAYDKVDAEQTSFRREQRRLASEAKTRESIAQLRVDNGIAVSGASLDQVWRKNGNLDSFFKGGNVVTQPLLQEMDKAGAVPTSVLGAIQTDLRSQDPQARARGIANLVGIKNYSAKAQAALYKDLPDGYAGVINRLENGQTPNEALAFLTRPAQTPDVEQKLRKVAAEKKQTDLADSTMKQAGFDPNKMSASLRVTFNDQWQDAYSRSGGDAKLAADLFRQDIAKNRTVGLSDFSGKVEKWPTKNYAPRETVTTLINRDFPETVGNEILPVFGGMVTIGGKTMPTYDVYVKGEDGLMKQVTDNTRKFYMTDAVIAAEADKKRDAAIERGVDTSMTVKENQRYWEAKAAETAAKAAAELARRNKVKGT